MRIGNPGPVLPLVATNPIVLIAPQKSRGIDEFTHLFEFLRRFDLDAVMRRTGLAVPMGVYRKVYPLIVPHPLGIVVSL